MGRRMATIVQIGHRNRGMEMGDLKEPQVANIGHIKIKMPAKASWPCIVSSNSRQHKIRPKRITIGR